MLKIIQFVKGLLLLVIDKLYYVANHRDNYK